MGLAIKPSDTREHKFYVRGPAPLAELLSVALWRQGRSVSPCGSLGATSGAVKAFIVDNASTRELASLVRRAARKLVTADADGTAEDALVGQIATYPIVSS